MPDKYLRATSYCESEDPMIKRLAERITTGKKTEREKAEALFRWTRDNIEYDIVPMVGARDVIRKSKKIAMCFDKTNVFVALARSIGIPTRYLLLDCELKTNELAAERNVSPKAKHIVAEALVDNKWVIVDPSFEPSISRLVETSQFGVPTWIKAKNVKRAESLSRIQMFLLNTIVIRLPFFKKLRNAIHEARGE